MTSPWALRGSTRKLTKTQHSAIIASSPYFQTEPSMPNMNAQEIMTAAREIKAWTVDLRRRFHQTPELMYEEVDPTRLVRPTCGSRGEDSSQARSCCNPI